MEALSPYTGIDLGPSQVRNGRGALHSLGGGGCISASEIWRIYCSVPLYVGCNIVDCEWLIYERLIEAVFDVMNSCHGYMKWMVNEIG